MSSLEITDGAENGRLVFDLAEVVALFSNEGPSQEWRIESLEAVAKPASGLDILELERQVGAAEGGLLIDWPKLQHLAGSLHQTINCRIVGSSGISIEAQDTTRWVVSCQKQEVVAKIRSRFERVRELKDP